MECSPEGDKEKPEISIPAKSTKNTYTTSSSRVKSNNKTASSYTKSGEKLDYMGIDEFVHRMGRPVNISAVPSNLYHIKDRGDHYLPYQGEIQPRVNQRADDYRDEEMMHQVRDSKKLVELEKLSKSARDFQELCAVKSECMLRKERYDSHMSYASNMDNIDRLEPRGTVITTYRSTERPYRTYGTPHSMPPILLERSASERTSLDERVYVSPYKKTKYVESSNRQHRSNSDIENLKQFEERNSIRDKLRGKPFNTTPPPGDSYPYKIKPREKGLTNDEDDIFVDVDNGDGNNDCPRKPDTIEQISSPSRDGLDYSGHSASESNESEVYNLDEQFPKMFEQEESGGDADLGGDKSGIAQTSSGNGSEKGAEEVPAAGANRVKKRGGGKPGRRRKRGYIYDPKPLIPKTKINTLPASMKDEEYWTRRQRNNEAAKRSRENRRVKELEMMGLVKRLTESNDNLRDRVTELENRNRFLEELLTRQKSNETSVENTTNPASTRRQNDVV